MQSHDGLIGLSWPGTFFLMVTSQQLAGLFSLCLYLLCSFSDQNAGSCGVWNDSVETNSPLEIHLRDLHKPLTSTSACRLNLIVKLWTDVYKNLTAASEQPLQSGAAKLCLSLLLEFFLYLIYWTFVADGPILLLSRLCSDFCRNFFFQWNVFLLKLHFSQNVSSLRLFLHQMGDCIIGVFVMSGVGDIQTHMLFVLF